MARTATEWFDEYGQSHKNRVNKLIHWICIPAILVATLGLAQSIPFPGHSVWLHWGTMFVVLAVGFYATLSWTLFAGMLAVGTASLAFNGWMASVDLPVFWISASVFFVAWVFQFIGHKIEGKKPSFFKDLQYLLIGPAWLLQFVYRQVGIPVETHASVRALQS
jgi:uncharacterized membrane protein YGL010W